MKGKAANDDPIGRWRSTNAVHQITEEQAANLAKEIAAKTPTKTHEEIITDKADKVVDIVVDRYLRQRQIDIQPTTYAEAVNTIYKMLREELRSWPHDDLLLQASFMLALVTTEKLRDRLI
ncbi:MAG: hypothetical protein KGL39_08485 [Patescibacteria group bacterium]|nr:hypothetical protein [Patescibacteria group bacterium]